MSGVLHTADGKEGENDQLYIDELCEMENDELRKANRAKEKL